MEGLVQIEALRRPAKEEFTMAANDWAARARQFLDQDAATLQRANTDLELRVAVMDTHAVLESTLRGYLYDVQQIDGTLDKSKMSFPAAVQVLQEQTGNSILTPGTAGSLLAFNRLRNLVVHDAYTPTSEEVQPGVTLAVETIRRLVGDVRSEPVPVWEAPFNSIANRYGDQFASRLGIVLVVMSILYMINPLDIPGPVDDVCLTAPCLFSAAMLILAARSIRERSAGRN
jgi:hypothetical protein